MAACNTPLRAVGVRLRRDENFSSTRRPQPQPRYLLPPLGQRDHLSREAHRGKLGYENHPTQPMWTRPRRTTGHPWACTGSEIAENATLGTKPVKASRPPTAKTLLRLNLENSLRPLRESRSGAHTGDLAEGLNRRGARNLVRCDRSARRDGNTGKLWGRETQASFDGPQRTC
ncbi:hypothetical protein B0J12DRAFT_390755 [Macrophomina phaseolina]|uniref:Uncharacterized protein n=1 Tax=Macrophomina phaseolina TaxID=35725 RepID=A0ABQ8FSG2_9PEZI|nr:hypothetical protein B0J12DRAFT_390755 [Macrophomina phaseolina]